MSSAVTANTNNGSSCQLVPAKNPRPPTRKKPAPRDCKRQNKAGTGRMPLTKSRRVAAAITSHADLRDAVQLAATNPDQTLIHYWTRSETRPANRSLPPLNPPPLLSGEEVRRCRDRMSSASGPSSLSVALRRPPGSEVQRPGALLHQGRPAPQPIGGGG